MKKRFKGCLLAIFVCAFVLVVSACGSSQPASSPQETNSSSLVQGLNDLKDAAGDLKEEASNVVESVQDILPTEVSYEEIYEEYSEKIRAATPGLIEEYKNEAVSNNSGLEGLAELANSKVEKLAEISNEGVEKMAQHMMTAGSGKYEEYEEWAGKLYDIYMEEAQKIMDEYMKSAVG